MHKRGSSFRGVCTYILHDPGKETSDRVEWVMTQHLHGDPEDAWFEMFDTYRNRAALKANAGVDARGRDNKTPVLHFTLSWHADDNPSPEHMRAMAIASLAALGLSEHEAVIAGHQDKDHPHVHVVVNTVHPYTGKTAPLKFSKLEFSRWAEAYELKHGIHCEDRIKNNERRREIAKERAAEKILAEFERSAGHEPEPPKPYEPVKDDSPGRRQWFERKEVIEKMKALRAALDQTHDIKRGVTWARHRHERDELDRKTKGAIDHARSEVKREFKSNWREAYRMQKGELRYVSRLCTHPLERAVYVFQNRRSLTLGYKPLSLRQMARLILSPPKLMDRVMRMHEADRKSLARWEKVNVKNYTDRIWSTHRQRFNALRVRQAAERAVERAQQREARKGVTFARAKAELIGKQDQVPAGLPRTLTPKQLGPQPPQAAPRPVQPEPIRTKPLLDAILKERQAKAGVPVAPAKPTPAVVLKPEQLAKGIPTAPKIPAPRTQSEVNHEFTEAARGIPSPKVEPKRAFSDALRNAPSNARDKKLSETFEKAASPLPDQSEPTEFDPAEELIRRMEKYRRDNPGRDQGREK